MYLERRVREALGTDLAQALVMVYCRHIWHPADLATLRAVAAEEPAILAQFDALDALHAEIPFQDLAHLPLAEELAFLRTAREGG